jgi:branched-chain amino acid transport system substrate-binding protein
MKLQRRHFSAWAAALAVLPASVLAQSTPGVSKTEVVVGSIQDLSGPLVSFGKPVRDGMVMRVEQANNAGGVHGRKIKLVVEDSGYDTKKAVLAGDKLINSNKAFAVVGTLGAAPAVATIDAVVDGGALHLFPLNSQRSMFDPFHKLKFAAFTPYTESTRAGVREMLKRGYKRVAILYQDDEFGLDVVNGTEAALKEANMALVEKTSYKRGATEFSSQMQKIKAANPDLIVLATIVRETIGSIAEARKIGYTGDFFGSQGSYIGALPKLGGKAIEGLYNVNEIPVPYRDNPGNSKLLNEWMDAYKARTNLDAETGAVMGWFVMDMFIKTLEKTGPNLTTDNFIKALESSTFPRSFLGTPDISFGPKKHLGNSQARIAQAQNGRWVNVTDFVK